MAGAQNQAAVYAIEDSCINNTSVKISGSEGAGEAIGEHPELYVGSFYVGGITPELGMVIKMRNTITFYITQMTMSIGTKKTLTSKNYVIETFRETMEKGTYLSEAGGPSKNTIKPGQLREFFVPATEVV